MRSHALTLACLALAVASSIEAGLQHVHAPGRVHLAMAGARPSLKHSRRAFASARFGARAPVCSMLSDGAAPPPPADAEPAMPVVPRFSWRLIFFFGCNPLALLPVAGVGALLKVGIGGTAFALTSQAVLIGAAIGIPLMLFFNLPLEKLPGLSSIAEVDEASTFITYLLFGATRGAGHFAKVITGSAIISACAGIAEELCFRGALQTGLAMLLVNAGVAANVISYVAIFAPSVLFGYLHSYSSSPAYAIAAFVASVYFGSVYAWSGNIVVPILAHFAVDFISLVVSYVRIAYQKSDEERVAIWACNQPIARTLRYVAGYSPAPKK